MRQPSVPVTVVRVPTTRSSKQLFPPRRPRTVILFIVGFTIVIFLLLNYALFFGWLSIQEERVGGGIDQQQQNLSLLQPSHRNKEESKQGSKGNGITNTTIRWEKPTTAIWNNILQRKSSNGNSNNNTTSSSSSSASSSASRIGIHVLRPERPATKIIVVGERHSGTTFFTKYLSDCFPSVAVTDTFVNNKHWFQPDPDYLTKVVAPGADSDSDSDASMTPSFWRNIAQASSSNGNGATGHPSNDHHQQNRPSNHYFQDSLVVVLFRNPYDWVEAMRRKPWHWPNHLSLSPLTAQNASINVRAHDSKSEISEGGGSGFTVHKSYVNHDILDWKEFIERPLYLKNEYHRDHKKARQKQQQPRLCQRGYPPNTISPCRRNRNYVPSQLESIPSVFLRHLPFDTNDPMYEKQPTNNGQPFEHLLQLRATKIKNFLRIPEQWELNAIGFVQYDSLLGNKLGSLMEEIGSALGIANGTVGSNTGVSSNSAACPSLPPFEKAPYNLSVEFRDWITKATQWDVESWIGYHRSVV